MKPVRFLPLVALATGSLLLLKLAGLFVEGGYMLTGTEATQAQTKKEGTEAAKQTGSQAADAKEKTASTPAAAGADKPRAPAVKRKHEKGPPRDIAAYVPDDRRTKGEVAILSSLAKRREALEKRAKALDLKANMLKAAERRIEERIKALKALQDKIEKFAKTEQEDKGEQYARLVRMYSAMKPKDAARIFNELDGDVLLGLIKQMKPQAMSAILAQMNAVKARDLTVLLAGATKQKLTERTLDQELPKIEGR